MKRKRTSRQRHVHVCIFVNKTAANYSRKYIKRLTERIRRSGGFYSIFEPTSASGMLKTAQQAAGIRRWHRGGPQNFARRGKVTALIACGGDGTFNIIARSAVKAGLPVGILPMGHNNNIARSLLGSTDPNEALKKISARSYKKINYALAGGQPFFGFMGIGFLVNLQNYLIENSSPRFSFGWGRLGTKICDQSVTEELTVKIDSFRFDIPLKMININLLSYTAGIEVSPASDTDDGIMEMLVDFNGDSKIFASYLKQLNKENYLYGSTIKLFRGKEISLEPLKSKKICLDGEMVESKHEMLVVNMAERQLKVFS